MKLTKLVPSDGASSCEDGKSCPAFYDTDGDFVVARGYDLPDLGIPVPEGERLVGLPKPLVRALAAQLGKL